jgi:hypothetical protein
LPQSDVIRLRDSSGERGRYIALSHCWGRSQPFTTMKETLEARRNGFSTQDVPATFRDAIMVARLLNIRYLWIDSLCIIQDDSNDWQVESSRMGEIYSNSYLTIFADGAAADVEGFLKPRKHTYIHLDAIGLNDEMVRVALLHDTVKDMMKRLQPPPLHSRAWALQERYLSRRKLHFMDSEMQWSCSEVARNESNLVLTENKWLIDHLCPFVYEGKGILRREGPRGGLLSYSKWYDMIEDYTSRSLSIESDRFPALSGVAKAVANSKGDQYFAGIWLSDIERGLLWSPVGACTRSAEWRAPSWSWASVNGTVTYKDIGGPFLLNRRKLAQVVIKEVQTKPAGVDPFGALESGSIELEAPLVCFDPTSNVYKSRDFARCDVVGESLAGAAALPLLSNGSTDLYGLFTQKHEQSYRRIGRFAYKGLSPWEYCELLATVNGGTSEHITLV